jgi:hypothetical protein
MAGAVYETLTNPPGSEVVVIPSPTLMVMDRFAVAVAWLGLVESVKVMTTGMLAPAAVGVPLITPAVLIASPAGKPVAVKV